MIVFFNISKKDHMDFLHQKKQMIRAYYKQGINDDDAYLSNSLKDLWKNKTTSFLYFASFSTEAGKQVLHKC